MNMKRPQYHFTPPRNWMNDPNGLIYLDGKYHLYYQHNPHSVKWEHLHWGHAVSDDLLTWRHLPIALRETEDGVMAYSGCTVFDGNNTSGFGTNDNPPLVAIYTEADGKVQAQSLAYSLDRGVTFTPYDDNPVLDLFAPHFRDPRVFWYNDHWVMAVALAAEDKIRFYGSPDLKTWQLLSDFGPQGAIADYWECPDIYPVTTSTGQTRWILQVSVGDHTPMGGSGIQYFVGHFDGEKFTTQQENVKWMDYGQDFYAAQAWLNAPQLTTIGWMNNLAYANASPAAEWRGQQSLPRQLSLVTFAGDTYLKQEPVPLASQYKDHWHFEKPRGELDFYGDALDIKAKISGEFTIRVNNTVIGWVQDSLFLDRSASENINFHPEVNTRHEAPLFFPLQEVRIVVDTHSVEVFAGPLTISSVVFPTKQELWVGGEVDSLQVWRS
jgi:fructan beta-fructosidase